LTAPALSRERPGVALPWLVALGVAAGATGVAVLSPVAAALLAMGLTAGALLFRLHGGRLGTWYLMLFLLPVSEPLGWDLVGTKTVYVGDLLLFGLFAIVLWDEGVRDLWRRSPVFRVGIGILFVSVLGLYGSPQPTWGIAAIRRILGQIAVLVLARRLVRTGEAAVASLTVFLVGMVPAIVYGFQQSTIPVEAGYFPDWADVPLAYDASGRPRVRIFSTYDHPLHLSQALSMAVGLAVGLLAVVRGTVARLSLLGLAAAAALCNQYTYSVSGMIGVATAVVMALVVGRRRRVVALVPVLFVAWLALAPEALVVRVTGLLTGATTSAPARIITYQQGLRAWLDHPLIGVGWGGISRLGQGEYQMSREKTVPPAPENYFLYRMVALGIPGAILYGALVVLFLRNCRRSAAPRPESGTPWPRSAILAAGAAFWVQGMFLPVGSIPNNYMLWLLLGLSESMWEAGRAPPSGEAASSS
jgi:hypothetical protein